MNIKTGPAVPRMSLADKIFMWMFIGVITGATIFSVMYAIEIACLQGTDRWAEIQSCWFNFKWGV